MSVCEVLEYPTSKTKETVAGEWNLFRDCPPTDPGIYLCAVRHADGAEEIRRVRWTGYSWGDETTSYRMGEVLAWQDLPVFPETPYLADSFVDDITRTEWQIFSDGAVFKKAMGMKAPRRDRESENNPAISRILELAGVRP